MWGLEPGRCLLGELGCEWGCLGWVLHAGGCPHGWEQHPGLCYVPTCSCWAAGRQCGVPGHGDRVVQPQFLHLVLSVPRGAALGL